MNEIRLKRQLLRDENKLHGKTMQPIPKSKWPPLSVRAMLPPIAAWRSRDFLAQVFDEGNGVQRISVCRTEIDSAGMWKDGITWDELQRIKTECGFGDHHAVEIYPPTGDVVNVANMRHLWVMAEPLPFAWTKETE